MQQLSGCNFSCSRLVCCCWQSQTLLDTVYNSSTDLLQVLAMQAYILRIYQPYLSQQPEGHPPAAPSNGHEMLSFITWTCKGPPPASGMGCAVALQALKQLQAALSGIAISLEAHGALLS